jgi:NitT/TauT family transport system substrate-binding protein
VNIAEHKGYFKEQGLTVEFNDFGGGGSDSLKALVSGSVDFIAGAFEHTLYLQARGQTITSVALQNNSFGVVIALSKEKAAAYKSPKDLVGLKMGVTAPGSSSALALSLLLSKVNLSADQISVIGVGAGNSALAMMKSGRLDGEANFDPVITRLVLDGDLVPVVDTRTKAGLDYLYGGPFAGSAISTTPDFIKANPRTVSGLRQWHGQGLALAAKGHGRRDRQRAAAGVLCRRQGVLQESRAGQSGNALKGRYRDAGVVRQHVSHHLFIQ